MTKQTIIPPSVQDIAANAPDLRYGGIIARFIAMMIDWIFVFGILFIIFLPLYVISLLTSLFVAPLLALFDFTVIPSFLLLLVFSHWVYFATMESSDRGATYGKRLMGLRVVDLQGRKISFARATLRYMAKIVSAIPMMFGYVMAIFTAKKQALHDLIAETLVVRR